MPQNTVQDIVCMTEKELSSSKKVFTGSIYYSQESPSECKGEFIMSMTYYSKFESIFFTLNFKMKYILYQKEMFT